MEMMKKSNVPWLQTFFWQDMDPEIRLVTALDYLRMDIEHLLTPEMWAEIGTQEVLEHLRIFASKEKELRDLALEIFSEQKSSKKAR